MRQGFLPVPADGATRDDAPAREASTPADGRRSDLKVIDAATVDLGTIDGTKDLPIDSIKPSPKDLQIDLPHPPPKDLQPDLTKPPSKNLLVNGGCELGSTKPGSVVGWTATSCAASWSCANKPNFINPPQAGKLHFFAGPCTPAELFQIVDVSNLAPWIDQGKQKFSFSGWVSTWKTQKDSSRFIVEYLPSSGTPLTIFNSGPLAVPLPWKQVSDVRVAPPGTRSIRVRIVAVRAEGTQNDGYSDSLSLLALP